jgi:hypothetical protein
MERPRIYSRTEERIPGEDLESRLEALRVVAGGLSASEMKATTRDDELRRETLDLLTRANQRVLAADERAVQLEADHRQREADLAAQIQELETRLQMSEDANARLEAAKAAAEERAARAEERSEATNQFLARVNDSLRDLAR